VSSGSVTINSAYVGNTLKKAIFGGVQYN